MAKLWENRNVIWFFSVVLVHHCILPSFPSSPPPPPYSHSPSYSITSSLGYKQAKITSSSGFHFICCVKHP
jgi:hypothetical protein